MLKQDNHVTRKETYQLPALAVGDILLVGKFKNRKATITGFSTDENNQPVAQTDKGDHKIFKPRIAKLMPAKPRGDDVVRTRVSGPAGNQSDKTRTENYNQRRHADLLQGLGYRRARRVQPWLATECR